MITNSPLFRPRNLQTKVTDVAVHSIIKTSYAADLRWRIDRNGLALQKKIAASLSVALGTVYLINQLFGKTGDVVPKRMPRRNELRVPSQLFI